MIDRDIVYELARKAGGVPAGGATFIAGTIDWYRFAALVAAVERERVAAEFDRRAVYSDGTSSSGWYEPHEPGEIVRRMK